MLIQKELDVNLDNLTLLNLGFFLFHQPNRIIARINLRRANSNSKLLQLSIKGRNRKIYTSSSTTKDIAIAAYKGYE